MIFERTLIHPLYTPYSIYFRMVAHSSMHPRLEPQVSSTTPWVGLSLRRQAFKRWLAVARPAHLLPTSCALKLCLVTAFCNTNPGCNLVLLRI